MSKKHIPGEGCRCYARSPYECGCDGVDWRSFREVDLEKENKRLKKKITELEQTIEDMEYEAKEEYPE